MRSLDSGHYALQWDRVDASPLLENSAHYKSPSIGHEANQHLHHLDIHPMSIPPDPVFSNADENRDVGITFLADPPTNDSSRYRHSMTPSTPSIYPSILPPQDDDFHEAEDDFPSLIKRLESMVNVPPRPPRSRLRESTKRLDSTSLTRSGSDSSHTYSNPPGLTPEPRPQDVLSRRTILDVRSSFHSGF